MKMKSFLAALFALVIVMSLCACGNDGKNASDIDTVSPSVFTSATTTTANATTTTTEATTTTTTESITTTTTTTTKSNTTAKNTTTTSTETTSAKEYDDNLKRFGADTSGLTKPAAIRDALDTIILHAKTRYLGFPGIFIVQDEYNVRDFDIRNYGVVCNERTTGIQMPTAYKTLDGEPIYFITVSLDAVNDEAIRYFIYDQKKYYKAVEVIEGEGNELEEKVDLNKCETIPLFETIIYQGYKGFFHKDPPDITANYKSPSYSSFYTEFYDAETGENILFTFLDEDYERNLYDVKLNEIVHKVGLGSIPVQVK